MIDVIKKCTGKDVKCVHVKDREGQIYKEVIHSKRLQSLGWKTETNFKEGIIKSYNYYKNNINSW